MPDFFGKPTPKDKARALLAQFRSVSDFHKGGVMRNEQTIIRAITRALDDWVYATTGDRPHASHDDIALAVYKRISRYTTKTLSSDQMLLLDEDEMGRYTNPRLVPANDVEVLLFPVHPDTDEPVETAIADFAISLPHKDTIPDI